MTHSLWLPDLPLWTTNAERSKALWWHRAQTADARRQAAFMASSARAAGHLTPVTDVQVIEAEPFQPRHPLADCGAHYPAVKAVIDGLVDARVLPADTPAVVPAILMRAPRLARESPDGRPGLLITLG